LPERDRKGSRPSGVDKVYVSPSVPVSRGIGMGVEEVERNSWVGVEGNDSDRAEIDRMFKDTTRFNSAIPLKSTRMLRTYSPTSYSDDGEILISSSSASMNEGSN